MTAPDKAASNATPVTFGQCEITLRTGSRCKREAAYGVNLRAVCKRHLAYGISRWASVGNGGKLWASVQIVGRGDRS